MQTARDRLPHSLDAEPSILVKQVAAIDEGEGTDVLGPDLIRPQHDLVLRGQPLNRHDSASGLSVTATRDADKGRSIHPLRADRLWRTH
ncbi:MAG TPA: hypothetical protein VFJ56_08320 [Nitrospira sp.]|nr:hypothetical protein [Nitrospira sp.]